MVEKIYFQNSIIYPYFIIEVANTHGGNINYVIDLIKAFKDLNGGFGIKFQPLNPDDIATKDYSGYNTYKQLYFNEKQWENIISQAIKTKQIWLDIFDVYGVNILKCNFDKIYGIKLQSSVLFNYMIIDELAKLDISHKKIILNIAGQLLSNIHEIINRVKNTLNPNEILLEFGYQAYPTKIEDSGLSKIDVLRARFKRRLVFADHIDGGSEDSIWLPIIAIFKGVDVIEKHVMLNQETKYDYFSSLTPDSFKKMVEKINQYLKILSQPFINKKEIEYLEKTIMKPILKLNKSPGTICNFSKDFEYKRTAQIGLDVKEIQNIQKDFYVLSNAKRAGETLKKEDFKKANIATIIAVRIKSSRLPQKAVLKIGDMTSIELCIKNCLKFENVQHTIMATSYLKEDLELKKYTYSSSVIFHQGHPNDVIERYLDIIEKLKIDLFIRVTGDCPYLSNDILQLLLKSHFEIGADYTRAKEAALGTNLEIINSSSLKKIKKYFPSANYSEYMTFYFVNNPDYFRLNFVELPTELIRNYRLTLDYPEDLDVFNIIEEYFNKNGLDYSITRLFKYLDNNPKIANKNINCHVRYLDDKNLIKKINENTTIKKKM